jgi:hypothetical protein
MTNLTRAKDAAEVVCAAGRDSALLHWKRYAFDESLEAAASDSDTGEAA